MYQQGQFEQSLPYFEKSLFADSKGILTRFFYVMALSKSEPKYSVQKKLFEMSESKLDDEALRYAKIQVRRLRYNLLAGLEQNYIHNALMGNDIVRWDIRSFPLRVYIEDEKSVPEYYIDSINRAMNLWSNSTNFVKFTRVNDKANADIHIKFKDNKTNCENGECRFVTAYTEPNIKDKILNKMTLTFYRTNPLNKGFTEGEIYNTALHELGHTLGIIGHSDNPSDLMFSMSDTTGVKYYPFAQSLSKRDLQTLILLYRLKPTISNVKPLESENFYYPQLILGSDDARLKIKLEEYLSYIKEYPEMAAG
ncbi:MAG: matrixin family metalloprotease, partial [Candidatus Gastranaerophilales bacterium]|nr:matrixin family metalloprotease [Candidatus Gastranaerophilales bacterium]